MPELKDIVSGSGPLREAARRAVADEVARAGGLSVYAQSIRRIDGGLLVIARGDKGKRLGLIGPADGLPSLAGASPEGQQGLPDGLRLEVYAQSHPNAVAVRKALPDATPVTLGLDTSLGCGDRLGLAGPGHLHAVRGTGLRVVLAQQSIREMTRTQRTPDQVVDAATWAVLQEGYAEGYGADADHLKSPEDVDRTAAAGFVMFTIDPGDHVDNGADADDEAALQRKLAALDWAALETTEADCRRRYLDRTFDVGYGTVLRFEPNDLLRAAVKYGRAVAHTVAMGRHIAAVCGSSPFEIEMSVDETDSPTSVLEHYFVAAELRRLGLPNLVSLAPRFIGEFEKGIDYKGDLDALDASIARHAAIARHCGPYKLSIHSGSDKFSVYPLVARHTDGLVHVKTAGTSYLEALRVIGAVAPTLFAEIYRFAYDRYDTDKATYHVSAVRDDVPRPEDLTPGQMPGLLDRDDTRQVFHVTFGSVLTERADGGWRFRQRLLAALDDHETEHYAALARHLARHAAPFARR